MQMFGKFRFHTETVHNVNCHGSAILSKGKSGKIQELLKITLNGTAKTCTIYC